MHKATSILIGVVQVGLTFVVLFGVYMTLALLDYQGGIANLIGITLVAPLFAALFSGLSTVAFFIVGLPIRFNEKLNAWWRRHFYLAILLVIVGLGLIITALLPGFTEEVTIYKADGLPRSSTVPNLTLSLLGVAFLALGTLHLYPPRFKTF